MSAITLPYNITFERWAAQLLQNLSIFSIPIHPIEENWWEWAELIGQNADLLNFPIPSKSIYPTIESWRKWASDLIAGLTITI